MGLSLVVVGACLGVFLLACSRCLVGIGTKGPPVKWCRCYPKAFRLTAACTGGRYLFLGPLLPPPTQLGVLNFCVDINLAVLLTQHA